MESTHWELPRLQKSRIVLDRLVEYVKMTHTDDDALCISQEPNGEGNYASTSDDADDITRQDVDLGLTLPPSDLSYNASWYFDGDAFQHDWLSCTQEEESQEDPSSQGTRVFSMFDDYQLLESPRDKQQLTNEEHALPTQEDETVSLANPENSKAKAIHQPSANAIQIQEPSAAQEPEPHPSPTDSGYGVSIATSCADDVNNALSENWNDHASELSTAQFAGYVPLQNSGTAEHPFHFDITTQPFEEDDSLFVDDPENSPSASSESTQPRDYPFGQPIIDRPGVRMPKGFGKKKLSKKEILKKGISAGWFGGKTSSENPTPQAQSISDLPIPIAIATALAPDAMRPAILETVFRIQSHQLHDPKRSSQPPAADPNFLQILEKLFSRYEKEETLRNTLITFVMAKLVEGNRESPSPQVLTPANAPGQGEGEFRQNINLVSMASTTFTEDLAKMEKAINDIRSPRTQQSILDAIITALHVMQRNAAHIRELIAGQPYTASLDAKNKALSKQVEGLAAKCEELQEQKQYRELTARGSKTMNPPIPASIRMPPEPPSPPTPFARLPVDFVPDPNKLYRTGFPHSNTAWMCLLTTTDTVKRCEAVNRTWSKAYENGFTLWTSRLRCVRCQQEHKSPATKYFLHESEVRQLGGLTRGNRSQGDSIKLASRSRDNVNPPTVSVAPLPSASPQSMSSSLQAPGSIPLPQNPFAGTIGTPQHMRFKPTPPTNNNSVPQPTNLPVQPPVQAAQRPAALDIRGSPASSQSHEDSSLGQVPHKRPRTYVDINRPLTAHMASPTLPAHPDPTMALNDRLQSAVSLVPRNETENNFLEGPWKTLGMQGTYGVSQTPMYSDNPPHHRRMYSVAPVPAPIDIPTSYMPQAGSGPVRRYSQPAPQHLEGSMPRDDVYITASTSNTTFTGSHPAINGAPVPPTPGNVIHGRKRSTPDDEVIITGSTTTNASSPSASSCSPVESSSQDSNPNKKRCRKLTTSNPPRETPRRISATPTPIPKSTGETLRLCLPGIERSWMKVGGHPDQPIAVDEDPAPQPVAKKKSKAGLPKKPAKPKAKVHADPKAKKTAVAAVPVTPVSSVPVEKLAVEKPGVEESAPVPVPSIEVPGPVVEETANDDDDMESLFGDEDNDEPENSRELSDEVADEWGAELEAMMTSRVMDEQIITQVEDGATPVEVGGESNEEEMRLADEDGEDSEEE